MGVKQLKASISCYPEQSPARAASFSKKNSQKGDYEVNKTEKETELKTKVFTSPHNRRGQGKHEN